MDSKTIEKAKLSLINLTEKEYFFNINNLLRKAKEDHRSICYVSLRWTYFEMLDYLKEEKIDSSDFYFIDIVSAKDTEIPAIELCTFLHNPTAQKLWVEIRRIFKEKNCEALIFDNVSTFLMYEHKSVIIKFTYDFLNDKEYSNTNNIYFMIKDLKINPEENSNLITDLKMFADKEIKFS